MSAPSNAALQFATDESNDLLAAVRDEIRAMQATQSTVSVNVLTERLAGSYPSYGRDELGEIIARSALAAQLPVAFD